jgi:Cu2+-exporting ATPase
MTKCDHCMLPIGEGGAVHEDWPTGRKTFCCHACRSIYRMIQEEGLGDFYAKRKWTSFGIPEALREPAADNDQGITVSTLDRPSTDAAAVEEMDLLIDGIRCASCIWLIERLLERTCGVISARINFATHRAVIKWDPGATTSEAILSRMRSVGYLPQPYSPAAFEEALQRQNRDLLTRFGTAAFFSMQLMTISFALYAGYFQGIDASVKNLLEMVSLLLSTPVVLYAGWPFIQGAWRGVRNGSLNMDALIVLGSWSAYGLSLHHMRTGGEVYFDTSVMIITLVLLGRYLESSAKKRASFAVSRLLALQPQNARIVTDAGTVIVPTSSVRAGSRLEIRPGERVPLDGIVRKGASDINESLVTGESVPRPVSNGSRVIGGTLNGLGTIEVEVTSAAGGTVLSQIAHLVEKAQASSAPIQRLADRLSAYFIPVIILLAAASFWYWRYEVPQGKALLIAVSVLVISCPCALGLATPVAILAGTGSAARRGILIKGGDILERLHKVDTIVLDKTGTITTGKLTVVEVWTGTDGILSPGELLQIAASVERSSEHLIGSAIVSSAKEAGMSLLPAGSFRAFPGQGAYAEVGGLPVLVGKADLLRQESIDIPAIVLERAAHLERQGRTVVYIARGRVVLGIIALMDTPKRDAAAAVARLKRRNIKISLITGDNAATAAAIGRTIGIERILSGVMPENKADEIMKLRRTGGVVAMIGDGINDAPALASSDVGIAMASGSDIAVDSAHIVLLRSDMQSVADALDLSCRTFRVVRQNLFWAFFYNATAVPLAMAGVLTPIVSAAAMSVSSVTVVLNSLRLKRESRP